VKTVLFSFFLIIISGCASVDLVINNQGSGPMRDLKIKFKDREILVPQIQEGQAHTTEGLKFESRSSPRITYLNGNGSKIWASAAVSIGPGDKGQIELERRTKKGSEEFLVHDRRKKVSKQP
jgi:hypothetical protein